MNSEPKLPTLEAAVLPSTEVAAGIAVERTVIIIAPEDPEAVRDRDKATLGDGVGTRSMATYLGNAPQVGGVSWGRRAARDGLHGS